VKSILFENIIACDISHNIIGMHNNVKNNMKCPKLISQIPYLELEEMRA
jgi:hypothetical protein